MMRGRIYGDGYFTAAGCEALAAWLAVQRAHPTVQLTSLDERTICEEVITGDCLDHD